MKKLSKEQIKIIYISAIALVFLICFWLFVYSPQSRKLVMIKQQLANTENEIIVITELTKGKEMALAVQDLSVELEDIVSKLPLGEEDVIYNLSEEARNLNIEVQNITPAGRIPLEGEISGYMIEELPIALSLVCDYRQLGDYLEILRNDFPVLVRVRNLDIVGQGEGIPQLEISLGVSAYLVKR